MDFAPFKCLSFDCYGTLIDWETGILSSLEGVLESHDVTASQNALLEIYGKAEAEFESGGYRPYREILKAALVRIGETLGFEPTPGALENFSTSVMSWPAFPDSREALKALATRYPLIILSNIDDDLFRHSQERLGIEFEQVFTAQQIGSYKPSQRNFEFLIEHAGVAKHEILHVAQSLFHDIAPAKEMGLSTVWINRREGIEGSGATPPAEAEPDLTAPDLKSFAQIALGPRK